MQYRGNILKPHNRQRALVFLGSASLVVALAGAARAQELSTLPAALTEKIQLAADAFADFENGEFALERGAMRPVDLDEDLHQDGVLDEDKSACSSAASLYSVDAGPKVHRLAV